MKQKELRMRLPQLTRRFFTVRALELAWVLLVFVIAGGVVHLASRPVGETWSLRDAIYAGAIVLAWYYIGFQYLLTSAVVMTIAWFTGWLKTTRSFVLFNLLVFIVHSLVVMLVILPGQITLAMWVTWLLAVIFNGVAPARILDLYRSETKQM